MPSRAAPLGLRSCPGTPLYEEVRAPPLPRVNRRGNAGRRARRFPPETGLRAPFRRGDRDHPQGVDSLGRPGGARAAQARARSSPRTTGAGSCSTSSTSVRRAARGHFPEVRAPRPSSAGRPRGRGRRPRSRPRRARGAHPERPVARRGVPCDLDGTSTRALPGVPLPGPVGEDLRRPRQHDLPPVQSATDQRAAHRPSGCARCWPYGEVASLLGVAPGAPLLEIRRVALTIPRDSP